MAQVRIDAEIIGETDDAILVSENGNEFWIPRRICFDGASLTVGGTLKYAPAWWYEANVK